MRLPSPQTSEQEPYVLLEDTGAGYIAQPSGHEVFYDEAAGLLHIVEGRMVSAVLLPTRTSATETNSSAAAASVLSSTPSSLLPASLSIPGSQLQPQQEDEENRRSYSPSPPPPLAALHKRTVSDAFSIASTATTATVTPSRAFLVSSGPPITAVCASLDGNFTALQRSKLQIEFLDHSNGNMFIETPQNSGTALHGFFWTDAPDAEFVVVTSMGLELYSPKVGSQGLKYTAFHRLSAVQWFIWSHSTRILVAGCGSSGAKLQAFQFSRNDHSGGVVRLSMLDLTPPWGSPMKSPSKSTKNQTHHAVSASPWLLVSPTRIWVLLLYRRVFIAYHDVSSNTLKLYRIYRDGTALFAECPLTSASGNRGGYHPGPDKIELSVVEDVIVVHFVQQHAQNACSSGGSGSGRGIGGLAILFDIAIGSGNSGPAGVRIIDPVVSTPTQLGVILLDEGIKEEENEMEHQENEEEGEQQQQQREVEVEQAHGDQQQKLRLFHPDLALDQASGRIFRLQIDLLALSEACFSSFAAANGSGGEEIPSMMAFLHRRQDRRHRTQRNYSIIRDHRRDPRHVILRVLRRMVIERAAPALLRSTFDAVLALSSSLRRRREQQKNIFREKASANNEELEEERDFADDDIYRSVDVKEIALGILAPALQVTSPRPATAAISGKPQPNTAANYVLAALSELFSSCYTTGNYPVNADVASLYLTAYSYAGIDYLLPSLLKSHAKLLDSRELAERLASGEVLFASHTSGSSISTTSKQQLLTSLALDMYTRLGDHKHVCKLLLQQGNVLAAVKHAQLFLGVDSGVLEDPENVFNAAYSVVNDSKRVSNGDEGTGEDNTIYKIALKRFLEDKRTKFSRSPHRPSSSSSSVDAVAASPSDFLDQQTASLVEALENF